MNNTAVTEEVNRVKNSPALLLWYTGDEPDGTSDPLNATTTAYDLIYSLDGYHPVSLVLNCENYYWTEYTAGADIVMQDTYPIAINATFSTVWVRRRRSRGCMLASDAHICTSRGRHARRTMETADATTAKASWRTSAHGWTSSPSAGSSTVGSVPRPCGPSRKVSEEIREHCS